MLTAREACILTRRTLKRIARDTGQFSGPDAQTAIVAIEKSERPDETNRAILAMQALSHYFLEGSGIHQAISELDSDGVGGSQCMLVAKKIDYVIANEF